MCSDFGMDFGEIVVDKNKNTPATILNEDVEDVEGRRIKNGITV